jgi:lysophosphatidylcholine acyltransferase/lyso-PAF acetyltransferase
MPHGSSADSLSSDSLGRQVDPSDRSTDGYGTSNTEDVQWPASSRAGAQLPGSSLEELVTESPFLDLGSPMTPYEWFKAVVLLPWAVFRLVASIAGLILVWAITRLLVIGVKPNEVGSSWRFNLLRPWLRFWTGVFLRLGLGFWKAKVTGWENYEAALNARAICVFNHVSYVDAIVMTHFFALSGVAKASVAGIPFVGAIAVALQFLFVQRRGSADARNKHTQLAGKTVEKIAARAADDRFPLLMIAPEGTTKPRHCMLRFSTGAFVPGAPVLPVLLKYRHKRFNVGWGITYNYWHLYRLLTQFINHLDVVLLPVYYPSDEEVQTLRCMQPMCGRSWRGSWVPSCRSTAWSTTWPSRRTTCMSTSREPRSSWPRDDDEMATFLKGVPRPSEGAAQVRRAAHQDSPGQPGHTGCRICRDQLAGLRC